MIWYLTTVIIEERLYNLDKSAGDWYFYYFYFQFSIQEDGFFISIYSLIN